MDEREKLDIVATALEGLKPVFGSYCALRKSEENGLARWPDSEIERLLVRLRDESKVIIFRTALEESWDRLGGRKGLRVPTTPKTEELRAKVFKPGDFKIIKRPNFDNWRASLKLKIGANAQSLTPINFEKVWITVSELSDHLEMAMSPRISLPLRFSRYTPLIPDSDHHITGPYRHDALRFLRNVTVVAAYEQETASSLVVILNLSRFQEFKTEIEAVRKSRTDLVPVPKENGKTPAGPPANEFSADSESAYKLDYTPAREVLVNGFVLAKLDFNSENDNILSFLVKNPNRAVTIEELSKSLGGEPPKKDLHKFAENIGLRGNLKKAFFSISKNGIMLTNPVTAPHLEALGLQRIKLAVK